MSAQTLFKLARPDHFEKLAAVLRPLCDEIDVVAYLRRPSDFYVSSAQQILKADHRIKPLAPPDYRAPLEGFAAMSDRLHVFPYDRTLFPGGDVMRHFTETFCPDAVPEEGLPRIAANVSISAESLAILAAYRRKHHADKPGRFTKDSNRLLEALAAADAELTGNTRLKLKPELARMIDQGSPDLLWLRETHGVVFDGIDYDHLVPMETLPRPNRIAEICNVDRKRKAATALHAMRHLAEQA